MKELDWTIAIDDALTERFPRCFLCRQELGQGRFDTFVVDGHVVMVTRCHRCARSDPTGRRVLALMAEREALRREGP